MTFKEPFDQDGRKNTQSKVSAYPLGNLQAQSYAQGHDAGTLGRLPPKPSSRTMSPGLTEFLMTLESAKGRAHDYSDKERFIVTRAINRANRSLANRSTLSGRTSGP